MVSESKACFIIIRRGSRLGGGHKRKKVIGLFSPKISLLSCDCPRFLYGSLWMMMV